MLFLGAQHKQKEVLQILSTEIAPAGTGMGMFLKPFPTYNKYAADDFKNIEAKNWKISIKDS